MKISTQWDLVGVSAALLTFVSFFIFMYYIPFQGVNTFLVGFGHPLLMIFYLPFTFISFSYGYLENKKEKPDSNKDNEKIEIVFINQILTN